MRVTLPNGENRLGVFFCYNFILGPKQNKVQKRRKTDKKSVQERRLFFVRRCYDNVEKARKM